MDRRYFNNPGYLDQDVVAGCRMPSWDGIAANEASRRVAAELGSRALLQAIHNLLLRSGKNHPQMNGDESVKILAEPARSRG